MKIYTSERWDELSWLSKRPVCEAVQLIDNNGNIYGYAWSPDGIGAHFYDTLEELESEH